MRAAVLAVLLSLAAAGAARLGLSDVRFDLNLASALTALVLLFLPYFYFGIAEARPRPALYLTPVLLVPYGLYAAGTGAFEATALLRLAAFLALPLLLVYLARLRKDPGPFDFLAVLALWLPFDLRLLEGIWTWPEGRGSYGFLTVMAVDLALVLFVLYRGLDGIGYRFRLTLRQLLFALMCFALFSAIAVPLGLAIDFLAYEPRAFDPVGFLGSFLAILLFIGIPEEFLFRGLVQNFFEKWWGRGIRTLLLAALVFGAAHLDNDAPPNFRYALMATLAGIFYGWTFRRAGNLLAPALVHALVDAVWRAVFR